MPSFVFLFSFFLSYIELSFLSLSLTFSCARFLSQRIHLWIRLSPWNNFLPRRLFKKSSLLRVMRAFLVSFACLLCFFFKIRETKEKREKRSREISFFFLSLFSFLFNERETNFFFWAKIRHNHYNHDNNNSYKNSLVYTQPLCHTTTTTVIKTVSSCISTHTHTSHRIHIIALVVV